MTTKEKGQSDGLLVRDIALSALLQILEEGQFCHLVLRQALEKYGWLQVRDRSFLTRLVQGTVERMPELDSSLNQYSKVPVKKMKPVIRTILRMTAYQIYYMDSVPDSAACNEAVKLAGKRGFASLKGFVNGVSRSVARGKAERILPVSWAERYSMPDWIINNYKACGGSVRTEQALQFLLNGDKSETTVHCNTSKASIEQIKASLTAEQVQLRQSELVPEVLYLRDFEALEELEAFENGWIQVQDLASVFACLAADVQPGDFCVDVCAAPGGKSIFAADRMKGQGTVISRDLSEYKTDYIKENQERCGMTVIKPQVWDAGILDESLVEKADVVIADLPCSGLGVIGGKPDIKYHQSPEGAKELAALQRKLLSVVWQYVKPGGVLVYSTCTVNPAENQENRDWFLEQFPFELDSLEGRIPNAVLGETGKNGYVQLLPGEYGGNGFYFARMRRKEQ